MTSVAGFNSYPSGPLLSGPLLGECGAGTARVWAQGRDGSRLELVVAEAGGVERTAQAVPSESEFFCVVLELAGLDPSRRYEYWLRSAHGETARYPLRQFPADDVRKLRLTFGSCYKDYKTPVQPIFDAIRGESPHCFLMLGDTCYFDEDDWKSEGAMVRAHLRNRNHGSLRPLVASVPTLSIWDDHDFGPNDSDGRYEGKDTSLRVWKRLWAQRRYGLPAVPGVFSSVRVGPAEVFLLDVRYYRRSRERLLGDSQWSWLSQALAASRAPVKLLASGSQFLPEVAGQPPFGWECWRRDAPKELEKLVTFLADNDIRGVLLLSGDPHLGYVMHQPGQLLADGRRAPELFEVTSSPLANRPWPTQIMPAESAARPRFDAAVQIELGVPNYGRLDIDLDRNEVLLTLHGSDGDELARRAVKLSELAVRQKSLRITAALVPSKGHDGGANAAYARAYLFRGSEYVRVNLSGASAAGRTSSRIDSGYPKSTSAGFPGAFPVPRPERSALGFDAVLATSSERLYFFSGGGYTRYDLAKDHADPGYPRYIARHWKGLFAGDFAGAFLTGPDIACFVHGSECIHYDLAKDRAEPGFPRPLRAAFPGTFADGEHADAAIAWSDGCVYFLVAGAWRCHDLRTGRAVPEKTHPDSGDWLSFLSP